ncbi:MAG: molecular chaperone DnaJ [Candidatus Subteraquimicrobiales bacterium]|nr:molecular chaperone DnaJ [Candidatus Subteraquimicrobiales bacterium]
MPANEDYYEIFGLSRDASTDEIKKAYRKLAKKYHPDVNKNDPGTEEKFKEIAKAYAVLADPDKRRQYDYSGTANEGLGGFSGFDVFDNIFDTFFSGFYQPARKSTAQRGSDILVDLKISFKQAALGVKKEIEVSLLLKCESCGGSGARSGTYPCGCKECGGTGRIKTTQRIFMGSFTQVRSCHICGGTGEVAEFLCSDCKGTGRKKATKKLTIEIPPGLEEGSYLRIPGHGEAGLKGGSSGDLIVRVLVEHHEFFKRSGDDVICEVAITLAKAALGAELKIPTLNGDEELKIPSGTQPGTVFRLKNKGILRNQHRGDQLVKVNVIVPTNLTKEEKELLIEFAKIRGEKF